jgi:hypothetical protein
MSGSSYGCLVYPEAAHLDFVPSGSQLEAVIRGLVRSGWVDASGGQWRGVVVDRAGAFAKVPFSIDTLGPALETCLTSDTFWLEFRNTRDEGDPTPFEQDKDGVFLPRYCENIYAFVSPARLAAEDPYGNDTIPCARCNANVLLTRASHVAANVRKALPMPTSYLPESCPHCNGPLDPEALSMTFTSAVDGPSPREERAPFFRFGLWLRPVEKRHPPTERITLSGDLPILLRSACGVGFRSLGTVSES